MIDSGYLLLHKQCGVTSFEALKPVKRALGSHKIGHTGTLDKFAQGLLIVLAGSALKLSSFFTNCDKHYEAVIHFGRETDTLDPEGAVIKEAGLQDKAVLEAALEKYRGHIMQTPPLYSAVHVNGRRAHEIARSGETAELKERAITIYKLELCDYQPPFAKIAVCCSAGTYIRSLARDIAYAANSCAHLAELVRTRQGAFQLQHATAGDDDAALRAALQPIDKQTLEKLNIAVVDISEKARQAVRHGQKPEIIFKDALPAARTIALFYNETLCALITAQLKGWTYNFVCADN